MISLTKLLCNKSTSGDWLRYSDNIHKRPIVVWNITRRCNLKCIHCYSDSQNKEYAGELTTREAKRVIDDLADFNIPVLLFSGGEPLLRNDLFELERYARRKGIRTVLSTNGTLINKNITDFSYVGISLDGLNSNNDKFRRTKGAFDMALRGIRNCKTKIGLRFTITKHNYHDIQGIFKLLKEERIERVCFYHLVYSGRGSDIKNDDLSHSEMKDVMETLCSKTTKDIEVLTVDNHTDSVFLYKKIKNKDMLKLSGGNSSGIGIACIDNLGEVHPDQFWTFQSLGNVRKRRFSDIWTDNNNPILSALRNNRKKYIKGKCSRCNYFDICNGNFRVRAYNVCGDIWQEDPACYLTEEEVC